MSAGVGIGQVDSASIFFGCVATEMGCCDVSRQLPGVQARQQCKVYGTTSLICYASAEVAVLNIQMEILSDDQDTSIGVVGESCPCEADDTRKLLGVA